MTEFKKVTGNKKEYLDLLLLADPSEAMIDRYLEEGEMYVLSENGSVICEAVVDLRGELKNIAVNPYRHKEGIGKKMIDTLCETYKTRFNFLYVGTSDSGVSFYTKCGFAYSHTVKNFFLDNYPELIIDDGKPCIDMIYLKRKL